MLNDAEVKRRRVGGAMAAAVGVLLLVLAVMAMTGKLGASKASDGVSKEAASAGATSGSPESGPTESGAPESSQTESAPTDSGAGESSAPESEQADVKAPLTVLNAGGAAGLAAKGKKAFEASGWQVTAIGNLSGRAVPNSSTVFYPGGDEQAQKAAESLVKQFPKLTAAQAPTGLGYNGVVVALTGDFTPGA